MIIYLDHELVPMLCSLIYRENPYGISYRITQQDAFAFGRLSMDQIGSSLSRMQEVMEISIDRQRYDVSTAVEMFDSIIKEMALYPATTTGDPGNSNISATRDACQHLTRINNLAYSTAPLPQVAAQCY